MRIKYLVAAATFAFASVSFAQESPPIGLVLNPSAGGRLSTTFQRSVNGFFLDTFTFTPSAVSGNVSVNLMPASGPINFFSALLNGQGFSFFPENGNTAFSFQSMVDATQPLVLQVLGFGGSAEDLTAAAASYSGSVTVNPIAAIPEPETYALMLGGLAMLSAWAKRRRRRA